MQVKDRLFFRMAIVTPLVVGILLFFKFYFDTSEAFIKDVSSVSSYLTVIGTLYSILAAFVIYVVWDQFNRSSGAVESETNDIGDLLTYSGYLNDTKFERTIYESVSRYADLVVTDEWKKLQNGEKSTQAEAAFKKIYECIKSVKFDDKKDPIAWQQIIKKFNDISDARSQRIFVSMERIPILLKSLLYLVSISVIGGFFLLGIENNTIAVAITALTTIMVTFIIEVVEDLDNPYTGKWAISNQSFKDIKVLNKK